MTEAVQAVSGKAVTGTEVDFDPKVFRGYLEPGERCLQWKPRSGLYCMRKAGWGTEHVGVGRCARHGGARGGYRLRGSPRLRELYAWHVSSPSPTDLTHEVALLRALVSSFLEELGEGGQTEASELVGVLLGCVEPETRESAALWRLGQLAKLADVGKASGMVETVSRVVERVERAKAMQSVPLPALRALLVAMAEVVRSQVKDGEVVKAVELGWGRIKVQGLGKALTVEGA